MKKRIQVIFGLLVIMAVFLGCSTVPNKPLYVENTTGNLLNKELNDDVFYSINYEIDKKEKKDVISFYLETAFNKYKLNFETKDSIKEIFDVFLKYAKNTIDSNVKFGQERIGSSPAFSFILDEKNEIKERLLVNDNDSAEIEFYFLLKDGKQYFLVDNVYLTPLSRLSSKVIRINSFLISKEDIEAISNFSKNTKRIDNIRQNKLEEKKELEKKEKLNKAKKIKEEEKLEETKEKNATINRL